MVIGKCGRSEMAVTRAAGILIGLAFSALVAGTGPTHAASQRITIGEVSALIPGGCQPARRNTHASEGIECSWRSENGTVETIRLFRSVKKNHPISREIAEDEERSGKRGIPNGALHYGLPAYLVSRAIASGLPPEVVLPKGFTAENASYDDTPGPGPNKMYGYCMVLEARAHTAQTAMESATLYCGAVGRNPRDLLIVGVTVSVAHDAGTKPPKDFTNRSRAVFNSMTVKR